MWPLEKWPILKPGVFHGQPTGLESLDHPLANFKRPFDGYPKLGMKWGEAVKVNPKLIAPALWFPYPHMGKSQTDILHDDTGGKFGPFAGQTFVGDLSNALVMRVFMEKVEGEYQGACFHFRRDFTPPILRMAWGKGGTMFAGGSSRGWGGGRTPYGLSRITWTGQVPFEIHEMRARPNGFELTFTKPVDPATAGDIKSYAMNDLYALVLQQLRGQAAGRTSGQNHLGHGRQGWQVGRHYARLDAALLHSRPGCQGRARYRWAAAAAPGSILYAQPNPETLMRATS